MIENSHLNHIESQIKSEYLSVPSKAILLEEGKVAEKLYLIRKGCLRLFFYNGGKDITFQFFFEGDFVASFDSLYKFTSRSVLLVECSFCGDPNGDRTFLPSQ